MNIGIGSKNQAKIEAVVQAFAQLNQPAHVKGVDALSGVSSQPMTDRETLEGAINRARWTLKAEPFDLAIGLEGGVDETPMGMILCNWCAIVDNHGSIGIGGGVRILVPDDIADQIREGKELGDVIDQFAGGHNIRNGEGTIGILTGGQISRSQMFRDSIICAMSSLR